MPVSNYFFKQMENWKVIYSICIGIYHNCKSKDLISVWNDADFGENNWYLLKFLVILQSREHQGENFVLLAIVQI